MRVTECPTVLKGLMVGLVAAGAIGCSVVGSAEPSTGGSSAPVPGVVTSTAPAATPASSQMRAGVRAAAAHFYELYSRSKYASFWNLLSSATKHQVSRRAWVGVHAACPSASAGRFRMIRAVTVFGSAAIVTEAIVGTTSKEEDVFSYANGNWSYSPGDLSIYRHGSVTTDVAAANAAGLCNGRKIF